MPKRNPFGPTKGHGFSSPRSNKAPKSFTKKSEDKRFDQASGAGSVSPFRNSPSQKGSFTRVEKLSGSSGITRNSFQKAGRKDSPGKPAFGKRERYDPEKKRRFSEDPKDKRPYKIFDKRADGSKSSFRKEEGPPAGAERRPFAGDAKRDRPYKRFNNEDKPRQNPRRDSFPGRSKEERPYKKSDKAPTAHKSAFHKSNKPGYKKRDSSSDGPYPYKPFLEREGKSPGRGAGSDTRPPKKFKKGSPSSTSLVITGDSENANGTLKKEKSSLESNKRTSQRFKGNQKQDQETLSQMGKIRLNKFIANSGVCSRREADELIKMGLISVNGKTITEMGYKVNPGDEVRHESKVLRAEKPVYILLNKPKGFLTTTVDPQERNTVMHLIGKVVKERVYPVGRLDRNTTGLLLLTNDGDLAEKLMHPSYNVKKIYKVELDRPLTKADAQRILEGVKLEEGRAIVDDLAIISDDRKTVGLEIHIGWNRVVRRIFEALEYMVVKLDRSVYAGLNKKDIGRGEWRFLKKEELVLLKHFQ